MKGLLYKDWTMIFGGYKTNFLFLLLFFFFYKEEDFRFLK